MSEVFIFEYVGVSGRFSDVGVSGSVDYVVPESVSEASFVNLGLMMLSAMCALILNLSFIAPVPQNGVLADTARALFQSNSFQYGLESTCCPKYTFYNTSATPYSKITIFNMVWRTCFVQCFFL